VTAPDAVPPGTTVDELAAALRLGAEGDTAARLAAVELLIEHYAGGVHGYWLGREPFRARVAWYPADDVYPVTASVDWHAVAELLATGEGLHDTGSERAVLRVAVALAIGPLYEAASSCDEHNRRLIVDAVAHAFRVGPS
jgi:hypothetical protein